MNSDSNQTKSNTNDLAFKKEFKYSHQNPYHDRLSAFEEFVLRDNEAEEHAGSWSKSVFKNENPLEVEIGTGYGHFMLEHTQKNPSINFIGLDHRFKRSFNLAKKLSKLKHKNFRYLRARGERLGFTFGESEIDTLYYFFPDPWPKKRHQKKRLFQEKFLEEAYKCLKPGGKFLIKTDHQHYYEWMLEHLEKQSHFQVVFNTDDIHKSHPEHFLASFQTKFEKIFLAQGTTTKAIELVSLKK